MQLNSPRPIRPPGWAFRLSALRDPATVLSLGLFLLFILGAFDCVSAWQGAGEQEAAHEPAAAHDHHGAAAAGAWEGSAAGVAYSEFNHHVAGWLLIIIALAELGLALRPSVSPSVRLLLPGALGTTGIFLLIWSDHEAWPVGSMSLWETLYGGDYEILQHKLYGVLALTIASVELLRRSGIARHAAWIAPLPLFAIIGGWMLFSHSHGVHPSAHQIALHHAIMGTLAITAGSSKLVGAWRSGLALSTSSRWELLWAGLILLIGIQLILYSE
jgi:hypothetical protein